MQQGRLGGYRNEGRIESKESAPTHTAFPDKTVPRIFNWCLLHKTADLLPPLTFSPILFSNDTDFCCPKLQGKGVSIVHNSVHNCMQWYKEVTQEVIPDADRLTARVLEERTGLRPSLL